MQDEIRYTSAEYSLSPKKTRINLSYAPCTALQDCRFDFTRLWFWLSSRGKAGLRIVHNVAAVSTRNHQLSCSRRPRWFFTFLVLLPSWTLSLLFPFILSACIYYTTLVIEDCNYFEQRQRKIKRTVTVKSCKEEESENAAPFSCHSEPISFQRRPSYILSACRQFN